MQEVFEHIQMTVFGMTFNLDTVLMSLLTTLILVAICAIAMILRSKPGLRGVLEATFQFLKSMVTENMPEKAQSSFYFIGTMFLFILFSNMLGLLPIRVHGFRSPTSDINITLGLALLVLIATFYYGCKVRGVKEYALSFFRPNVLFFPIHLIDTLIKPFSLAFRLFGNIFAGEALLFILYLLVPIGIPTIWLAVSVFIGVIQAYLFAMLSIAYISAATNH